jgi:ketosteroid isomerase-like protein
MVSTSDVLDRHLKSFAEHDVDGVVGDYPSDAVLFVPSGPLKGPEAIKPFFEALISEFAKPGSATCLASPANRTLRVKFPVDVITRSASQRPE